MKYKKNGLNIVLDVDSSTVLTVDELTYELLDHYEDKTRAEIIAIYQGKYPLAELNECLDELDEVKEAGLLFREMNYIRENYANEDLIKALCLHVAHDCNLKCSYCFAAQGDFDGEKLLMPLEVGKKAIDFIIEQSKNRENLEVDFFGGEPLMNLDVVKQLVVYGNEEAAKHQKKFKFTMTTNGVLLNAETREYLNETMDNIVLSLDGRKSVHDTMRKTLNDQGSFDVIINNIKAMTELRGG